MGITRKPLAKAPTPSTGHQTRALAVCHPPHDDPSPEELVNQWQLAAGDVQISGELELIYQHIAREVADFKPKCDASGRCCQFQAWGHRLYVTGLEAAYLIERLDQPLKPSELEAAIKQGNCPFQHALLCSVHAIRPLGCRVYYCDERAKDWQETLSETALRQVKSLHDRHHLPYRYGEWREMLKRFIPP